MNFLFHLREVTDNFTVMPKDCPAIAILTDFGSQDDYVAQMKGVLLQHASHIPQIDITHEVRPYDIHAASYLLSQSAPHFPAGCIFLVVVDPGVGSNRRPLLLQTQESHYYVGPDNGCMSGILKNEGFTNAREISPQKVHSILSKPFSEPHALSPTFHGRDLFAPVCGMLATGLIPDTFGPSLEEKELVTLELDAPELSKSILKCIIQHIDHYGNIITNFPVSDFPEPPKEIRCNGHSAPFVTHYAQEVSAKESPLMSLCNSNGWLELACKESSASEFLRVTPGEKQELSVSY